MGLPWVGGEPASRALGPQGSCALGLPAEGSGGKDRRKRRPALCMRSSCGFGLGAEEKAGRPPPPRGESEPTSSASGLCRPSWRSLQPATAAPAQYRLPPKCQARRKDTGPRVWFTAFLARASPACFPLLLFSLLHDADCVWKHGRRAGCASWPHPSCSHGAACPLRPTDATARTASGCRLSSGVPSTPLTDFWFSSWPLLTYGLLRGCHLNSKHLGIFQIPLFLI